MGNKQRRRKLRQWKERKSRAHAKRRKEKPKEKRRGLPPSGKPSGGRREALPTFYPPDDVPVVDADGFRIVGPAKAMVDYAQPLMEVLGETKEGLDMAMAVGQVCWNLAIARARGEDDEELREIVTDTVRMLEDGGVADATGLLADMVVRYQEMFPDAHKGGGFYMRERVLEYDPWHVFDESELPGHDASTDLTDEDRATHEAFAALDGIVTTSEFDEWEELHLSAVEAFEKSFLRWLVRLGASEHAASVTSDVGSRFLDMLYRYVGEPVAGRPENGVREFLFSWSFRKVSFEGHCHSSAPSTLPLVGRYLDDLGHTEYLGERLSERVELLREEFFDLLQRYYGPPQPMTPKSGEP